MENRGAIPATLTSDCHDEPVVDDELPKSTRPVDIVMIGGRSARRERFLAGAASVLWPSRTDLELTVHGAAADPQRLGAARIVLDVGRDRPGPLDRALAAAAIAAGAVVVTDDPEPPSPLVPGRHVLVAPFEHLAEQAAALSLDEPRRLALADAARSLALASVPDRPSAPARPKPSAFVRQARRAAARALGPDPQRLVAESEHLDQLVAELKAAYVAQVDHRRALEATLGVARGREATISRSSGSRDVLVVSVVVPMHRDVIPALTSVAAALERADVAGESIVVGIGAAAARAAVPWSAGLAIDVDRALGPGDVVDAGVDAARGEHVIVLDPGERLFPNAIAALLEAIRGQPATVVGAYGITATIDDGMALGVCGHLDWSVDVLVRERAFDAVALVRRDAWGRLGTSPTAALLDGWQRTDRHLAIAEHSWRLVPTRSMIAQRPAGAVPTWLAAIAPTGPWLSLFERHPRLPWPS